jgi:aminobenzoyl-glutamate utilization protein B
MDIGWNFRREHLRLQQRSHYVIPNGGDQPNVVPPNASVWYYLREVSYPGDQAMWEIATRWRQAAAMMTDTTVTSTVLGSAVARPLQQDDRRGHARQHREGRTAGVVRGRSGPRARAAA